MELQSSQPNSRQVSRFLSRTVAPALLCLAVSLVPGNLQAALFEISGTLNDGTSTLGSFSIVVDDTTEMVHTDAPLPSDEILANDWYSYDVVSALVQFGGIAFDETDIYPSNTFPGTPDRDLYLEDGPIGSGFVDFYIAFDNGADLLLLGFVSVEDRITSSGTLHEWKIFDDVQHYSYATGTTEYFRYEGGTLQQVPDQTEVPEPGTMILLGTVLVGLGIVRRKR